MRNAVIVSAVRTAVGKAPRGSLHTVRPDDLAAVAVRAAIARAGVAPADVEDVILGCALPEAEQGMNVGRIAALAAGLPVSVAGQTVSRFCASGLQAIAIAAQQIISGMGDIIVAGGVESMSMIPMAGNKFSANPTLAEQYPDVYLSMGLTAENLARRYSISRSAQDAFALRSHLRAAAGQDAGKFDTEIVPVSVSVQRGTGGIHELSSEQSSDFTFDRDEGIRRDTSAEALARLQPAFHVQGSVTAGNSSQTSDGAAALLLMSEERAAALGLAPLARFVTYAAAGVPPEIMGIGPVAAVPRALNRAGLQLSDIGLIELNEAFAAQALAVIRELSLREEITNVNGGAIALGHPLGCTGAKLSVQILHELQRRDLEFGLVTLCVGGGMGVAGIFQRLN